MTRIEDVRKELTEAHDLLTRVLEDQFLLESIAKSGEIMAESIKNGGKIISCGNGGSQSDAMHFAEEMTGRFREDRVSLPAMAISDPAYLTCAANDYGYDKVFSRFIEGMGNPEDVLLAISTSGNSANVINAVIAARKKGMTTILLSGNNGGNLREECDHEIIVPHNGYSDRIQEIHIKIIHILISLIERTVIHK